MPVLLLPMWTGPSIAGIAIDCSLRETHKKSADISNIPIETGSSISDHRRTKPAELTLEGIISDAGFVPDQESKHARYLALMEKVEGTEVFDVITGLRIYRDMVFTDFQVTRDATTGEIIQFTAQMQQIQFATSKSVPVIATKADNPRVANKTNQGEKTTTPAPEETAKANGSILSLGGRALIAP